MRAFCGVPAYVEMVNLPASCADGFAPRTVNFSRLCRLALMLSLSRPKHFPSWWGPNLAKLQASGAGGRRGGLTAPASHLAVVSLLSMLLLLRLLTTAGSQPPACLH